MNVKRLTTLSILIALALIMYFVEAQIPTLVAIPGIKIGLANVVTLLAIYILSRRDAAIVLALRILIGNLLVGQIFSFFYSAAGGICCFLVMCIMSKVLKEDQIWAVSVFGAIAHNIGQIAIAVILLGTTKILWYLPALTISSVVTGLFTGFSAQFIIKRFKNIRY
ncbi:MAG: Gx transporter family protein [Eubacteriales bacterium]